MRLSIRRISPAALAAALLATSTVNAHADSSERNIAKFASGSGNLAYLAAGALLPLATDGDYGKNHSLRVIDSALTSTLITEGLKVVVREKRPDSNEHDSFPSGHATAAFAVATAQSALHPRQAPLWFAGATIISWSRLRLNRHHPQDVIAGALIGFGVTRWEFSEHHGLLLQPWIHNDKPGVMIERSF
jgi:membrane-associated phospholipid phosphatase